jgi:uncharacterized protein (TIGR02265 family)
LVEDSFVEPTWHAALDVGPYLATIPANATVKGMFVEALAARLPNRPRPRYVAFKDYPLGEYMQLLVDGAKALHPKATLREGLRRIGQDVYPVFVQSTVGRVLLGVLGDDVAAILRTASRAYRVSLSIGSVRTTEVSEGRAIVALEDMYAFPDCYQVGVFEGAIMAVGKRPRVRIRKATRTSAELLCEWT